MEPSDMSDPASSSTYTVISFAPVQGFIEKSRKLRDLFGSSYLLSFLSWAICYEIEKSGCTVISPALSNVTQGMPNQIVVEGQFPADGTYNTARKPLDRAWKCIVESCQDWLETHPQLQDFRDDFKYWKRDWGLWASYTWEFFWVQGLPGESISKVRDRLNDAKRARAWTGINWVGESSTLSGADAIAYPKLGNFKPQRDSYRQQEQDIATFFRKLSDVLTEPFVHPDEELSIPELVKRMVTHHKVASHIIKTYRKRFDCPIKVAELEQFEAIAQELNPHSFRDLNRLRSTNDDEPKYWTGWFLGDGDSAGKYLKSLDDPTDPSKEAKGLETFSTQMRKWGRIFRNHYTEILPDGNGRIVYAGGDDFMGILYGSDDADLYQIQPRDCLQWLSQFKSQVWDNSQWDKDYPLDPKDIKVSDKPITVSVGFVWAAPNVPQRDVLQHARAAEQAAKWGGRDRLALRILFNGGNHLEWTCPWWLLEGDFSSLGAIGLDADGVLENGIGLMNAYCDRHHQSGQDIQWTHFYNDVAALESRHAFHSDITVALGLIEIYFGPDYRRLLAEPTTWWNVNNPEEPWKREFSGILGDPSGYDSHYADDADAPKRLQRLSQKQSVMQAFNRWVINLAKVGFHLHRPVKASGGREALSPLTIAA
ncbi:MAG: type III-B CRISPR-associated protein Cas10/Cmr2 [Leptolyngbyaceae bacterium]|nr:type III-B CRISPR-associated protein Cas10/Cmr2 [Leptolyngbyaceae bacterium]